MWLFIQGGNRMKTAGVTSYRFLTGEAMTNMGAESVAAHVARLIQRAWDLIVILFALAQLLLWRTFRIPTHCRCHDSTH